MRKLASILLPFSAGIFAANYIFKPGQLLLVAALLTVAAVLLLLLKRKRLRLIAAGMISFALALGWFALKSVMTEGRVDKCAGETISIQGEIVDYPISYDRYDRIDIRILSGELKGLKGILYDNSGLLEKAQPGQRFEITAKVKSSTVRYGEEYRNNISKGIYFTANSKSEPVMTGMGSRLKYLPQTLNRRLTQRIDGIFPKDTAHFIKSLMLGDKSDLYDDVRLYNDMTRAGLMHIVAVSGLHVAFVVGLIRMLLGSSRLGSIAAIMLVWAFVTVTGATPSAVRAGVMQTVLVMAPLLKREDDGITSLSLALFLILVVNPYAAGSISLQLSFAAMAGLILISDKVYALICPKEGTSLIGRLGTYLAGVCSGTIGVMAFTMPLTAIHFGTVQILSFISNILALPLVSLCFCGAYISCFLSLFWTGAGTVLAGLVSVLARIIFGVARLVSSIPFGSVYFDAPIITFWLVMTYVFILAAILIDAKPAIKLLLAVGLSVVMLVCAQGCLWQRYRQGAGWVTAVDVGQGQSLVFMSGDNTVIVDCGNISNTDNAGKLCGEYLLCRGRKTADCLVLTHLHQDHASGVELLLEQLKVERLIIHEEAAEDELFLPRILESAARNGTRVDYLRSDTILDYGNIHLQLFAPVSAGDENERAISGVVSMGMVDTLFTADMSMAAERELIREHELRNIELYIVGHHGSKYSSSEDLLEATGADTAVISVGYNTFGHPTDETLERLRNCGYNVYRTDQLGTIEMCVK